jgi:uncharacterized protein (DUF4415 family)
MPKRHTAADTVSTDNPEWTLTEVQTARPASEVLPTLFGAETANAMLKPRGRPVAAVTKEPVKLRLDADVVAALRATGDGWQTRINAMLRASLNLSGKLG